MRRAGVLVLFCLVLAACGAGNVSTTAGTIDTDSSTVPANAALPTGPSALDDPDAEGLPTPTIDLDRLLSGGPPPDGIPPIDVPSYTTAADIDFLADREPVLVVTVGDETKIFPVQIMTWHEIVNDTIGGTPVTISFCPLCNSAITYDRRVAVTGPDGPTEAVLDFGTSGMLYNSALIMYDRQTESLWSHFSGSAVAGVLTDTELARFPTSTVAWSTARAEHPDAEVLDRDTGHSRDYGRNPYGGYDDVNSSPFLFDGEVDGRLAAKVRIVGILGEEPVAIRTEEIGLPAVVDVDIDNRAVTVWRVSGTASALDATRIDEGRDVGSTGVFERSVDGETLTFEIVDGAIRDTDTESTWSILGTATDGPMAGTALTPVDHVDTFWFAWAAFLPETRIVPSVG